MLAELFVKAHSDENTTEEMKINRWQSKNIPISQWSKGLVIWNDCWSKAEIQERIKEHINKKCQDMLGRDIKGRHLCDIQKQAGKESMPQ